MSRVSLIFFDRLRSLKGFKPLQNPYILFSPFLLLFIVFVLIVHNDAIIGDEGRYLLFAQNLLNGFYSPPAPDINLWNGPGYPIILMPFVFLKLPMISITLLNAFFQYLSVVFLFKSIHQFASFRISLVFSLFWAFCYSSYSYMALILTESFTVFLISSLILSLTIAFTTNKSKYLVFSGFILGYLALTKVVFGYVLLLLLIGSVLSWIGKIKDSNRRAGVKILFIAFITVTPYLIYTYDLTGRPFYWSNSGGMTLYWMSTPHANEYGDWNNESFTANHVDEGIGNSTELLKLTHQKDMDVVLALKGVEKDDAYRRIAIDNIKNHPLKYLKNISANVSRLLFGFPGTYTYQRPQLKIWYFAVLYTLMLFCLIPTIISWRKLSYCIRFILAIVSVYLGISLLVSVDNRQLIIIVPVLLFWIANVFYQTVSIKVL